MTTQSLLELLVQFRDGKPIEAYGMEGWAPVTTLNEILTAALQGEHLRVRPTPRVLSILYKKGRPFCFTEHPETPVFEGEEVVTFVEVPKQNETSNR